MDNLYLEIPEGWDQLVSQMVRDIKPYITEPDFDFVQIKEKFGGLRAYTQNSNEKIEDIIQDYEHISYCVCSHCGKPASYQTVNYILPYCKNCLPMNSKYETINFVPTYTIQKFTKKHMETITRDCSLLWKRYKSSVN